MSLSDKVIELTREDDYISLYEKKHVKEAVKRLKQEIADEVHIDDESKMACGFIINRIFGEELLNSPQVQDSEIVGSDSKHKQTEDSLRAKEEKE